jgi:hypothetical protein
MDSCCYLMRTFRIYAKENLVVFTKFGGVSTYLLGWNLDTNFFNSFCELFWLNGSVIVEVEVLESLHENLLLRLSTLGLLR